MPAPMSISPGSQPAGFKRIVVGSDHAGFELKQKITETLVRLGLETVDLGTGSKEPCDYPDFARAVAEAVSSGEFTRGILCCGSGIGVSIVANKVRGVRAALCQDCESARLSRQHNDANVLCLGARAMDVQLAQEIVRVWLSTNFEGGRHQRRVSKIERPRSSDTQP